MTGIADAYLDRAPLVAITGQAGPASAFKESHQSIDIVDLLRPVTKWNAHIEEPAAIPEIVRKAFRLARLEKLGATHIELPEDVAQEEVEVPVDPEENLRLGVPEWEDGAGAPSSCGPKARTS